MPRSDELWTRIRELVGDVETPGTLRRQAADLGAEMGDHGVLMAIDRATHGAWMPPAVRYKYQHFFTHWAVLAIMRLGDRDRDSTSIPALTSLLRTLHQEGGMTRDSWIEAMGGAQGVAAGEGGGRAGAFRTLLGARWRGGLGGY